MAIHKRPAKKKKKTCLLYLDQFDVPVCHCRPQWEQISSFLFSLTQNRAENTSFGCKNVFVCSSPTFHFYLCHGHFDAFWVKFPQ